MPNPLARLRFEIAYIMPTLPSISPTLNRVKTVPEILPDSYRPENQSGTRICRPDLKIDFNFQFAAFVTAAGT